VQVTDEFVIVDTSPVFRSDDEGRVRMLVPGLAIPTQSGKEFACPSGHLKHFKEALPSVTKVLIIGWRGLEQHFIELLRSAFANKRPLFQVVCGSAKDSAAVIDHLHGSHIPGDYLPPTKVGFSKYVTRGIGEDFLKV
jgi:hypothetical protein